MAYVELFVKDETSGIDRFTYEVVNSKKAGEKEGKILTNSEGTIYYFTLMTDVDGEINPQNYIKVTFYDNAGLSTTAIIDDLVMDKTPPTIKKGESGMPEWINSTTKEALECDGNGVIDIEVNVDDNMTMLGTAWKTLPQDEEDDQWELLPTSEGGDCGLEGRIEGGEINEDSFIYIDPDKYDDGYYRILIKAWDHTLNKKTSYIDFQVDKTEPTIKVTELKNTWYNEPIDIDIKVTDSLSGVEALTIYTISDDDEIYEEFEAEDGNIDITYTVELDGNYDLYITATDIAGNDKTIIRHIRLDQQEQWDAPQIDFYNGEDMDIHYEPDEWSNTDVKVKYGYSKYDRPVSGLKLYTYGKNDSVYDVTDDTQIFDLDGIYTFRVNSTSNAGLVSDVSPGGATIDDEESGYIVKLDKTAPIVNKVLVSGEKALRNNAYFNHDVDLHIDSTDNLSGVRDYFYRVDNGDWVLLDGDIATISSETEYSGSIYFKVRDNAENESFELTIDNFNIDTTKPTITYKECEGNDLILQSSEPITKFANGYLRFNDAETGQFVKTIYMNNNRIRIYDDLIYIDLTGVVASGDYSLTIDADTFFDRAGNMNGECTMKAKIISSENTELTGAIATLPSGTMINAAMNRLGDGYHITIPTNTKEFKLKPIYNNPELVGALKSSFGMFDENGELTVKVEDVDELIDIKMGDRVDYIKVVKLNYSVKAEVEEGIKASTDSARLEEAVDIYDIINEQITDIILTLSIKKADASSEEIKKDQELANTVLEGNETLSYPIDISIIQTIDNEQTYLHHLQSDIPITIEIPEELRGRQWYKIVRIHDGDADILEAERDGYNLTFNSYRFSTYFIMAGPHIPSSNVVSTNVAVSPKNWNFVVPYYGDDRENIEPLSIAFANGALGLIRYIGKDGVKARYNSKSFPDLANDHWSKNSVDFLAARNIFKGTSSGNFDGSRSMSRAEAITILVRLTPNAESGGINYFEDVDADEWFAPYVNMAYELGITQGVGGNRFDPRGTVSREDFATMIYRYMGSPEIKKNQKLSYTDADEIDSWAKDAIVYMTANKIMQGTDNNEVLPMSSISRYESAELLAKTINHIVSKDYNKTYKINSRNAIEDYPK